MSLQAKLIGVIGLLLALAGVGGAGFHFGDVYGTNAERVKSQAAEIGRKDVTIRTLQDAAEQNRLLAEKQANDARNESQNHENELTAVRAERDAAMRRRVPIDSAKFCRSDAATAAKATTIGGDGQADPGAAFLPESLADDLRRLAADADEVAADLRTLKSRVEAARCFAGS